MQKPDRDTLREAALRYLARYAATEAAVVRVLDRRVARWVREGGDADDAGPLRAASREIARALVASGVVDDALFAQARARSLARSGRSRAAIAAHLATRGVAPPLRDAALPVDEFRACVILCRRRRLGPFGPPPADPLAARKQAGILARAGFAELTARRALRLTRDEAEAVLQAPAP